MGAPINDLVIKDCIQQGINDLIAAPWLIRNLMGNISQFPSVGRGYEQEVQNCIDFLTNNKIHLAYKYTKDTVTLPAITISLGSSNEMLDRRTMGDAFPLKTLMLTPSEIGKPIPYIIKPFTPISFDSTTGAFTVPTTVNLELIVPGMVLLNPTTGQGYVILSIGVGQIFIETNQQINWTSIAVWPQYPFYSTHQKQTWFEQSYTIGLHIASDPAMLLFLEAVVSYILLRYREVLLESKNFCESKFSISDFAPNSQFSNPESAYSRYITLSGITPYTWFDQPSRIIENSVTTIEILSNLNSPSFLVNSDQAWETIADPNTP